MLEYIYPTGSLDNCLHPVTNILDIFQTMKIMIDIASALEHLHFPHSTPIIHCDLKPNNILLDENVVAHLSDFSIGKLVSADQ